MAVDIEEDNGLEKNHGSPSSDLFKILRHTNQRRGGDVLSQNCQNGSLSAVSGKICQNGIYRSSHTIKIACSVIIVEQWAGAYIVL